MPTQATPSLRTDHFRFRNGLFVHPLNPKAWVMCVLAWGNFAPALGDFSVQLPVVILTFVILPACSTQPLVLAWVDYGQKPSQ